MNQKHPLGRASWWVPGQGVVDGGLGPGPPPLVDRPRAPGGHPGPEMEWMVKIWVPWVDRAGPPAEEEEEEEEEKMMMMMMNKEKKKKGLNARGCLQAKKDADRITKHLVVFGKVVYDNEGLV